MTANPERQQFLNLAAKPARLTAEEAAWFLGFQVHDLPVLIRRNLLKPLGSPSANANCTKYFGLSELEELRADRKWLAKTSDAIRQHWQAKNRKENNDRMVRPLSGSGAAT